VNLTTREYDALLEGFARQFAVATRTRDEHLANCGREWDRAARWLFGPSEGFVNSCRALGLEPDAVREAARKRTTMKGIK